MAKDTGGFSFSELKSYLTSKMFMHTIVRILLFLLLFWLVNSFILKFYTNHGQKLSLPNYIGMGLEDVEKNANRRSFEIVVTDSIHIVGKPGGIVLSQEPKSGSKVKRGRKIYISVSKYNPDLISMEQIPELYGKKFAIKYKELFNQFELYSKITSMRFDPGPEGHILEVYYKGKLIVSEKGRDNNLHLNKGDTLEFVLSNSKDGEVQIPQLLCLTYDEAVFLLSANKLEVGAVMVEEGIEDKTKAYVSQQTPAFEVDSKIKMGSIVDLKLTIERPAGCE